MAARKLSANRLSLDIGVPVRSQRDGWSEAVPINCNLRSDGFREGLNPSYELKRNIVVDEAPFGVGGKARRMAVGTLVTTKRFRMSSRSMNMNLATL